MASCGSFSVNVVAPCAGLTTPVVLHFGDAELLTNATDERMGSSILYDPADYPGVTSIRFRAFVARDTATYSTAPNIKIVDENAVVYLNLTPTIPNFGMGNTAFIDVAFTPDSNAHTYYLQLSKVATTSGKKFQVSTPELWVFLTASKQAKLQIPMAVGFDIQTFGVYSYVTGSYAAITGTQVFKNDAGRFKNVDYRQLRVVAEPNSGAGKVALFDKTADAMVAGSELTIAIGDLTHYAEYSVQFAESAMVADHEYELRGYKTGVGSVILILEHLYVKIGSGSTGYFTSANLCACCCDVYVYLGVHNCENVYNNRAYQHNTADWPTTTFYWESTDTTRTIQLADTGTLGAPSYTIIDTQAHATPGVIGRMRSSLSPSDGHIYGAFFQDDVAYLLGEVTCNCS